MRERNTTTARVLQETNIKISDMCRELSYLERKEISKPELFRRVFNINEIGEVLRKDSKLKSKFRLI